MSFTYYYNECHECGHLRRYCEEKDKKEMCPYCGSKMLDSGKVMTEQERLEQEEGWRAGREKELYEQYIKGNEEREAKYQARQKKQEDELRQMIASVQEGYRKKAEREAQLVHCPRCGSVNVGKANPMYINGIRMCHADFRCHDCGFKWKRAR